MIEECRSDNSDLCHEMLTKYGFTPEQMHRAAVHIQQEIFPALLEFVYQFFHARNSLPE